MYLFEAGGTLRGAAGTATAITVTVSGISVDAAGVETLGLLYQGQLPASAGVLFTVPAGKSWIVKTIIVSNATASAVSGVQLFQNGAAAANSLIGPLTMAGSYTLTGSENGWAMTDASGVLQISGGGGGGGGTVTSVGLSLPAVFAVSGSPVTGSGTLTGAFASQPANEFLASPNGSSGVPGMRVIAPADLPVATTLALGAVKPDGTTVTVAAGVISAAAAGAVTLISKQTPSGVTTVSFTAIPGTFTHLRIVGAGRSSAAGTVPNALGVNFNSDSGANYAFQSNAVSGSTPAGFQSTGQTTGHGGEIPTTGTVANYQGSFVIDIPLYAGTTFAKTYQVQYITFNNTTVASMFVIVTTGTWNNTAAVTQIDLKIAGNWVAGSTVSLYGIV